MTTNLMLTGVGSFGFLAILHYLLGASFKNMISIGIRAYPRVEHRRRYEQWMLLPLLGLLTSVTAGLATGLMVTGGMNILWGMTILSVTFMLLSYLGLFVGLVRREDASSIWGPDASLEAIHGEIVGDQGRGLLQDAWLESYAEVLRGKREELRRKVHARRKLEVLEGIQWPDRPWAGFGVIRADEGIVQVPFVQVLDHLRHQTRIRE